MFLKKSGAFAWLDTLLLPSFAINGKIGKNLLTS
jgi:hypothetical protein